MNSFNISFSLFFKYLFIFGQIQNYSVYQYSDLTYSLSDKLAFGPSQVFSILGLTFEL
jgi:hypothetical protein